MSKHYGLDYAPGQLFCTIHIVLGWDEALKKVLQNIEKKIGHEKLLASLNYIEIDNDSFVAIAQAIDTILRLISPEFSHKSLSIYFAFSDFMSRSDRQIMAFALKDRRFGKLSACAAVVLYHWSDLQMFL